MALHVLLAEGRRRPITVIAWDGKTLAADKRASSGGHHNRVTKIWRLGDVLAGGTGSSAHIAEYRAWFVAGAVAADFPAALRDDEEKWAAFVVIDREGGVRQFEGGPHPIVFDPGQQQAFGSGRDYALAALHLGKTAVEAVAVASALDPNCGNGVDTLTFE